MCGDFRHCIALRFNRSARSSLTISVGRILACVFGVPSASGRTCFEFYVRALSDFTLQICPTTETKCWIHDPPIVGYWVDGTRNICRMDLRHALPGAFLLRICCCGEYCLRDRSMGALVGCQNSWSLPHPGLIRIHTVCLDVVVCFTIHG